MSNPDLDELIRAHRSEVHLSGEQRARGRARLLARVGASAAVIGGTSAAAGAGAGAKIGLGLLGKVGIGLALVGLAGGGYYVSRPAAPPRNHGEEARLSARVPDAKRPGGASGAEPRPENLAPTVAANDASAPSVASNSPGVAAATTEHDARAGAPRASSSARSSLADEVKTMQQVDAAMRAGNAQAALDLLGHAGSDEGSLKEERAAARIFALCRLGKTREASQDAVQFARRFPRSPLLGRVQNGCAQAP
jgi:hypothetical protein